MILRTLLLEEFLFDLSRSGSDPGLHAFYARVDWHHRRWRHQGQGPLVDLLVGSVPAAGLAIWQLHSAALEADGPAWWCCCSVCSLLE